MTYFEHFYFWAKSAIFESYGHYLKTRAVEQFQPFKVHLGHSLLKISNYNRLRDISDKLLKNYRFALRSVIEFSGIDRWTRL